MTQTQTIALEGFLSDYAGLTAALNAARANVLVADLDFNIIYANPASVETLLTFEDELRSNFGVGVGDIVGKSIHTFHKSPERIERILTTPQALPHATRFTFGHIWLEANVNAIYDQDGNPQGYIVAWKDITSELEKERQVEEAADLAEKKAHELHSKVQSILEVVEKEDAIQKEARGRE